MHIAIDDTDSPLGMCTTFLGALVTLRLSRKYDLIDLSYLIRLNPNIPFKTRGNAAVSMHFKIPEEDVEEVFYYVKNLVEKMASKHGKTQPAVALIVGENSKLRVFYKKALSDVIPLSYALKFAQKIKKENKALISGKRGLVGALAALGAYPLKTCTYELLFYRPIIIRTPSRKLDEQLIFAIDRKYRSQVFANIDYEKSRILVAPHGPDPVLLGIRGFSYETLLKIAEEISSKISYSFWFIYKTNQGLGLHTFLYKKINMVRPYQSVRVLGKVEQKPIIMKGGHIFLRIADETGSLAVAFFKDTGFLNRVARLLSEGDLIEVAGGIQPPNGSTPITLNAELLRVIKTSPKLKYRYPTCPRCGHKLESAGRNKGLKCRKCGFRTKEVTLLVEKKPRILEPGLYIQSPRAYRHLSITDRLIVYRGLLPPTCQKIGKEQ